MNMANPQRGFEHVVQARVMFEEEDSYFISFRTEDGTQCVRICVNSVFFSWTELVDWLRAVAEDRMPCQMGYNEEGPCTVLSARDVDNPQNGYGVEFTVSAGIEGPNGVIAEDRNRILFRVLVRRWEFVEDFCRFLMPLNLTCYRDEEQADNTLPEGVKYDAAKADQALKDILRGLPR